MESSLVPTRTGGGLPSRAIYAESMYTAHFGWGSLRMIRDGEFKFIDGPTPELYDLGDPLESRNLAGVHLATVSALYRKLQGMNLNVAAKGVGVRLPADRLQALATLGYLGR
jgi:hypothetical protein